MCNRHCCEASLDELLRDGAVQLLMRCDRVTEGDVRALLVKVKEARPLVLDESVRRRPVKASDAGAFPPIRFI